MSSSVRARQTPCRKRAVVWLRSRGDDRVLAVAADVSREEGAQKVVDQAVATFGGIDILVNNVGTARGGGLLETTDELWRDAIDQTLMPAVRMSRLAVPHMQRRGGGSIVIIASIYGREAGGRMTYNAVKAAEISLAKSMAQQLAPMNIRVNSVSPGSILFEGGSWWKRQQDDPAGDRRVREARAPVRTLRQARRGRRCRRVPLVVARQLDQRHVSRRRRLSEPGILSASSVRSRFVLVRPGFGTAPMIVRIAPTVWTSHRRRVRDRTDDDRESYSSRSVRIGCMNAARAAGISAASVATSRTMTATLTA